MMNLLRQSFAVEPENSIVAWGHFILRVSAGLMIFYIHGWHKLEGLIAYRLHGTPWTLAEEVAAMHLPAPIAYAAAATIVQLICALFITVGLFTRVNAASMLKPESAQTTRRSMKSGKPD